jgi:hypothetical protein
MASGGFSWVAAVARSLRSIDGNNCNIVPRVLQGAFLGKLAVLHGLFPSSRAFQRVRSRRLCPAAAQGDPFVPIGPPIQSIQPTWGGQLKRE